MDEETSTLGLDGTEPEPAAAKTPSEQEETPSRPRLLQPAGRDSRTGNIFMKPIKSEMITRVFAVSFLLPSRSSTAMIRSLLAASSRASPR